MKDPTINACRCGRKGCPGIHMADVTRIGAGAADCTPASIAERLRDLADLVESGELTGVAVCAVGPGGRLITYFEGVATEGVPVISLMGAAALLLHRIQKTEDSDP